MATVKAFNSIKVAGKQHGSVGSHAIPLYHEANSQTFKAGAPGLSAISAGTSWETGPRCTTR